MFWRVEVREKAGFYDALAASVMRDAKDLGMGRRVRDIKTVQVYLVQGSINENEIRSICENLFADPITQDFSFNKNVHDQKEYKVVEVAYNAGVMDPVEDSAKKAILDLGINGAQTVKTAKKYLIKSSLSYRQIHSLAEKIIFNKVIQHLVIGHSTIPLEPPPYKFCLKHVNILKANKPGLKKISRDMQLFLNLDEMTAIRGYFKKLSRNPTDCEIETIAQTWSEHCKHKTFRGQIEFQGKTIKNLLKTTVMRATKELNKPWCVSVFKDNSGVIRFDKKNDICFKVETHNHPSALEPYGGAGTGLGGVIRDPLGTGMGAKPIINTDIFCFGPSDYPYGKLPKGVLHPKRVMKGVVAGVRDYGNRMGIPTTNGAVLFDEDFLGNPLVFCGNVGIMPRNKAFKKVSAGDLVVVVGGRTGRDGIHGATFSSGELTHESEEVSGSAVQIGNPIQEKKMTDILLEARDLSLYTAITDCGAGGLSSAVGEMAESLGARVDLDKVPLKYKGLRYDEIWISEAQERMVISVKPSKLKRLQALFESENVEATAIGEFTGDGHLRLFYEGNLVCSLNMKFMHDGLPDVKRKAVWAKPELTEPDIKENKDLTGSLLKLLATPNIASKEWIIRQYDHEVQGGSVLKPLQGITKDGPGDASVTRPVLGSNKGIILSCGINADYGKIDPYWMAAGAIDEALRQIVAVGGDIEKAAILDNFCWGNTNKPDRLGGLVRASWACYDIAKGYGVPFISGKDSLNNEFSHGKKTISIPPTLLVSCIAVMDDVTKAITMDLKRAGNPIYLVGLTRNELGGSQYYKMNGSLGNNVPRVNAASGKSIMLKMIKAIEAGSIISCHDCSDGGMSVTLAEMAFAGGLGMDIKLDLRAMPSGQERLPDHTLLFSESNSRFIAEVKDEALFKKIMKDVPFWKLGYAKKSGIFKIADANGKTIVKTRISALKSAWQSTFKNF